MKKKAAIGTFLSVALFGGVALADTNVSVGVSASATVRQKGPSEKGLGERLENRVQNIEENNIKTRVETRIQNRIDRVETRITAEFDTFLKNLQNISTRLESAIKNISAKGGNVVDAEAKLVVAKNKLSIAATAVADFDTYANSIGTSTASKTFVATFRTKRQAARAALADAFKSLKDTIVSVKTAAKGINITASTSASVSASTSSTQ